MSFANRTSFELGPALKSVRAGIWAREGVLWDSGYHKAAGEDIKGKCCGTAQHPSSPLLPSNSVRLS